MIGKVLFESGGKQLEAILDDDGRWSCEDEAIEQVLNMVHSCKGYSVADGRFGWAQLTAAAEMLEGKTEGIEADPETEDLVY